MRSVVVQAPASTGDSPPVILDQYLTPQSVGVEIAFPGSASATCSLEWSLDDPYATYATSYAANANWFADKNLTAITSLTAGTPIDAAGNSIPVRALKLTNTAWISGQPTLTVVQVGIR